MKTKGIKREEKMKATNVFVTILLVSVVLGLLVGVSSATWCSSGYAKRVNVSVNNTAGSALTDYQVYVNLSSNPINETSLRVYNSTSCTLRPHWCEEISSGNCTKLWINYSAVAASAWTNNTAIYYDNVAVSSTTNGNNTFIFFDDFERSNIETNFANPWTRYASNPVFVKNATNSWDSYFVNDPEICKHLNGTAYQDASNNYFMYYSGSGHDDGFDNDQIGLALSTDLNNWTRLSNGDGGRVLKFGNGVFQDGQWDDADVQLGTVLYDSGTFHMWYNGNNNPSSDYCRLGYANSTDGKNWTKYASNPILSQGTDGDADDLYVPTVIKDGSTWKMWYAGQKAGGGRIAVMYATAPNPQGPWTKYSNAHIYDPGYNMFPTSVWNESGVLHLIFFPLTVTDLRHATSSDGINWTYDGIIFERGNSGQWDDHHIQEVSQILVGSTWYSFYTGGGTGGVFSNGYATSTIRVPTPTVSKWTIYEGTEGTNLRLNNGKLEVGMMAVASSVISATFSAPFVINSYVDFATSGVSTAYSYIGPSNANIQSHFGYNSYLSTTKWNLYKYPANTNTQFGTAASVYKDVEIKVQASSQEGWIGTDNITSDTNFGATDPYIRIYGNNGVTYVEFVFIRKYASSEPPASLGSEEQQGANPTLHIDNVINIKEDWGRNFNSNLSANVIGANASGVWMNFTNAEFTNASLGNLNLTLNEWVNESHNVNAPVTNVSVTVTLNSTTSGATNDTDSFYYEITKRTNTATMDSALTQNVDTSESFYVNATCNEEYGDTFLGAANLLEDGTIIDTDTSVTNYVNFSHSESSAGQYNYTVRFYNLTHYNNVTTPTYSNVTVYDVMYEPPNPTNLQNITGDFWVNHTWSAGTPGNATDSFNVSVFPGWYNATVNTYYNDSGLTPHDWSNITVWAYNNSGNGSLSSGSVSDDVQIPNNAVTLTVTQNHNKIETETVFISDTSSSDADSDTPTYSCNRTDLFIDFSTVSGYGNWTTGTTDSGTYYVDIGVSDGWSSTDNKTLTITITDATPGTPIGAGRTMGNFWVNQTWIGNGNTDSFNVSVNLSWNNGSSNEHYNNTGLPPHGWSNFSVWAFNSTSKELSTLSYDWNQQLPNNLPVLSSLPDNTTDEDVNQTNIFDLDTYFSDVDSDTPTYQVESNNQSAYVSVTINASNNVSYTLASGWNGTASVVLNATDGWGGEDNDTFLIIVNAAPLPGDYTPGDPTTLQNTTGNYWVNYTWDVGGGNVTDSYNVSWNLSWFNNTLTTYMQKDVGASGWANITVYAYNSSGNGSLSAGYISDEAQAPAAPIGDYVPPAPINLTNSTGNGWVNYTWSSGGGANITDSYNVSWNATWYNNTLVAYMNDSVGEFGWANISVWAYNTSGNGSLSAGSISGDTQAGGGTYTTSMGTTVYNLITYYGSSTSTAEQFGLDIGAVDYIAMYNGSFHTHTMGFSANNFTTYHGIGYYVYLNASGSSTYQRNNIPDIPYNTQLFNRWNTIGWTNATNTNAEGIATSIGSACKYTSMLNADGITYTTHTVGFTSNNHPVDKGKGYWMWVNTGVNWGRNS